MQHFYLFFTVLFISLLLDAPFLGNSLSAQHAVNQSNYLVHIKKAIGEIKLDGNLDEADWQTAELAAHFFQNLPDDSVAAFSPTEVRLTYNDRFLYISAVCYNSVTEGNYVIQSLKRDFSFPATDAFAVSLDPFNRHSNGFSFGVSAAGAQREGTIDNSGVDGVTTAWDNKWFSEVKSFKDKWIVELAIPFNTLRYADNLSEWGINFARNDLRRNEASVWAPVPTQYNVSHLLYTGLLAWDAAPQKNGANISVLPYIAWGVDQNALNNEPIQSRAFEAGADAKIAITSSLNLDLTVNPDFAQVDVDAQVTNLDRFNIFFPERRNFFTENSDLFRFGIDPMMPFFSRTIGAGVPILAGARLTGNINNKWRMGLATIQTEGIAGGAQSQNYTIATLRRQLWNNSGLTGFWVNRQAFDGYRRDKDDHNAVGGLEFNYGSADGKWGFGTQLHQTFTNHDGETYTNKLLEKSGAVVYGSHDSRHISSFVSLEYIGQHYIADAGFVPELYQRNDMDNQFHPIPYYASFFYFLYKFYPKKTSAFRFWGPETGGKFTLYYNNEHRLNYWQYYKIFAYFKDQSIARLQVINEQAQLFFPTNITGRMDSLLQPGAYHNTAYGVEYERGKRHRLNGLVKAYYGAFFNGTKWTINAEAAYRIQPWGNFALTLQYNDIHFPQGFGDSRFVLLGPKVELTFTKSLFFTTFLQYNTQAQNFNLNSRFQWRFAPMSDLFVVLTDNFFAPENFDLGTMYQKNWGITMKLNYWLSF